MDKIRTDIQSEHENTSGHSSFTGSILNALKDKGVTTIFGDPIVLSDKKVVPVARLRITGGGGGGASGDPGAPSEDPASGGGGGGYLSVRPLGVFEITDDKTHFKPAYNATLLVLIFSVFTFGLALILTKSLKK